MEVGTTLAGRFVLDRVAGSGGMGVVYQGRDTETGWDIAVKLLHPTDAMGRARFEREVALLSSLEHETIIGYAAHGATTEGRLFLITEWVEGESLTTRLSRGPLSITETLVLGRRLAEALSTSHGLGIIHRDVKPSNVLLPMGSLEDAKLIDFGIAHSGAVARPTQTGMIVGTPGYMAPEQARGDTQVDARTDLFSLGCVLYEALTGVQPFDGEHVMAILAKILLQTATPIATLRPAVPPELAELVTQLLEKEPEDRPESAEEVLAVLEAVEVDPANDAPPARAEVQSEPMASEVELVSVVVVTDPDRHGPPGHDEMGPLSARATVQIDASLWGLVSTLDGTLEMLADGSHLVVFKGGRAATDLAAHATRCAIRIREMVDSAALVTLATGSGRRGARLPVGEAIDRAVSLARTVPRSATAVWVDDVTAGLIDARWELRVDGGAHRIIRERSDNEKARTLLGKPTPFVGRMRELRMIEGIVQSTLEDKEPACVLVKGAAGSGKTRLRIELLRRIKILYGSPSQPSARPEYHLCVARASPEHKASPLAIAAQIARAAAGIVPDGSASFARRTLWGAVERCIDSAEVPRVAVFLGELCKTPFEVDIDPPETRPSAPFGLQSDNPLGRSRSSTIPPRFSRSDRPPVSSRPPPTMLRRIAEAREALQAAHLDPLLLGDQIQRAFEDFLLARCAEKPLFIIIDDLHWADPPSMRFLDRVLREAKSVALCVLGLGRPEIDKTFPGLWADRHLVEVRLSGISPRAAEELSRAVLGKDTPNEIVGTIVSRADGNALCLEELIRAAANGDPKEVPKTVLAIAQARLSALPAPLRKVLRAASVLGNVFWRSGVAALLGGESRVPDLSRDLRELVALEIIEREVLSRHPGEEQYTFRHNILCDAAYSMLPAEDRPFAHSLAADWLSLRGETDARTIASHLSLAGRREQTPRWLLRAAEQALEAGELPLAVELCERASMALSLAVEAAEAPTLIAEAPSSRAPDAAPHTIRSPQSSPPASESAEPATVRAAEVMAELARMQMPAPAPPQSPSPLTGESRLLAGSIQLLLAEAQRWRGAFGPSEEAARSAMDLFDRGTRPWFRALGEAIIAAGRRGDHATTTTLATRAASVFAEQNALSAQLRCFCAAAKSYLHGGLVPEADVWISRAAAIATQIGSSDPRSTAEMYRLIGARARQLGDPVADRDAYRKATLELARAGDLRALCNARTSYGFSCIQLGDFVTAEQELTQALAEARRLGLDAVVVRAKQNLGLCLLARGDLAGAIALEDEVIKACEAQDNARFGAWTRVYRAKILERSGDFEGAAREAELSAKGLGDAPSALAGAYAIWALSLAKLGDEARAHEKATEALAILDRLGTIEEFEATVRVAYLTVFGEPGAQSERVLREGKERLMRHADRLEDPIERARFLKDIEEHRALFAFEEHV